MEDGDGHAAGEPDVIAQFDYLKVMGRPTCLDFEGEATSIPTTEQFQALHRALGYGDLRCLPPHNVKMKPGGYVIHWQAIAPTPPPLMLELQD